MVNYGVTRMWWESGRRRGSRRRGSAVLDRVGPHSVGSSAGDVTVVHAGGVGSSKIAALAERSAWARRSRPG